MEHEPWEYMVEALGTGEIGAMRSRLNGLGVQGWELVSVTSTVKQITGTGNDLVLVLKRRGEGPIEHERDRPGYIAY